MEKQNGRRSNFSGPRFFLGLVLVFLSTLFVIVIFCNYFGRTKGLLFSLPFLIFDCFFYRIIIKIQERNSSRQNDDSKEDQSEK